MVRLTLSNIILEQDGYYYTISLEIVIPKSNPIKINNSPTKIIKIPTIRNKNLNLFLIGCISLSISISSHVKKLIDVSFFKVKSINNC